MTPSFYVLALAGMAVMLCAGAAFWLGAPARFLLWGIVGQIGAVVLAFGLSGRSGVGLEAAALLLAGLLTCNTLAWLGWRCLRGASKAADLAPARGQAKKMPAAGAAFTVGALASAGVPGSPSFTGGVLLFFAAGKVGGAFGLLAMVVCAAFSLAWLLACLFAIHAAYFEAGPPRSTRQRARGQQWAWLALAVVIIALGFVPSPLISAGMRLAALIGAGR